MCINLLCKVLFFLKLVELTPFSSFSGSQVIDLPCSQIRRTGYHWKNVRKLNVRKMMRIHEHDQTSYRTANESLMRFWACIILYSVVLAWSDMSLMLLAQPVNEAKWRPVKRMKHGIWVIWHAVLRCASLHLPYCWACWAASLQTPPRWPYCVRMPQLGVRMFKASRSSRSRSMLKYELIWSEIRNTIGYEPGEELERDRFNIRLHNWFRDVLFATHGSTAIRWFQVLNLSSTQTNSKLQ